MRLPLLTLFACACGAGTPTAAQQANADAEGLADRACVTDTDAGVGKTKRQADIDECRAAVVAKYHDGGVR